MRGSKKFISAVLAFTILFTSIPVSDVHAFCMSGWNRFSGGTVVGNSNPQRQQPAKEGAQSPKQNPANDTKNIDPVCLSNGEYYYQQQDLFIAARGLPIDISRTYRSQREINAAFGYGWFFNFYQRIKKLSNNNILLVDGSAGRKDEFTYINGSSNFTSPAGTFDKLVKNPDGTYTITDNHGGKRNFDLNGNLSSIVDRNANALTYTYSATKLPVIGRSLYFTTQNEGVIAYDYQLTKITDSIAREITFTYNEKGRMTRITDFSGREINYAYDQYGDLTSVQDAAGNTTQYAYDSTHNLTSIIDAEKQTYLTNVYDSSDRIASQTYGNGSSTVVYATNQTTVTNRRGVATTTTFNTNGNPVKEEIFNTNPQNGEPTSYVTTKEYDANMNLTRVIFPAGNSIVNTYDSRGNVLSITRKAGGAADIVTSFTYEPNFNFIKTVTDPLGRVTTYNYDSKGNLTQIIYPVVNGQWPTESFTYDIYGEVLTVTNPAGVVSKYEYNSIGYLTKITADYGGVNSVSQMTYDNVGDVLSVTDPLNHTTTFIYDSLNRLTQTNDALNHLTKYSYDQNSNLIKLERQADDAATQWQTTEYFYDTLDQLIKVKQIAATDIETNFTYDLNGNKTSVTDAENHTTNYTYNKLDQLSSVTDALNQTTVYSYDLNGNLKTITDANNNPTNYEYDGFDRLVKTIYPDASYEQYTYDSNSNLISKRNRKGQQIAFAYDALNRMTTKTYPDSSTVSYAYDLGSRLTQVTGPDATIGYSYDNLNRVLQTVTAGKTIGYEYDKTGNRTKLIYPDNSFITYSYDSLNRLNGLNGQTGETIAAYSYDTLSRRIQTDYANNTQTVYSYDNLNRLLNLANRINGGAEISSFGYSYDFVGNKLSKTTTAGTESYGYDNIYQLTSITDPQSQVTSYAFDKLGNRVTAEGKTYTANNLNQYTQVDAVNLTYDSNGNLTNQNGWTYEYDYENRLTGATNGTIIASYAYDPFGRRISKTVDGVTTNFVYDGDAIIAEYNTSGMLTKKYVNGAGIDEVLMMESAGQKYYYHYDGLGSVTEVSDNAANIIEKYKYGVYGSVFITDSNDQPLTTSAIGNTRLFTGREFDLETGLYFYRSRYYSSELGRFLQTDKIGYEEGMNLYKYCYNSPNNYIDPSGNVAVVDDIGVWAGVAAAAEAIANGAGAAGGAGMVATGVATGPVIVGATVVVGVLVGGYLIYKHFAAKKCGTKQDNQEVFYHYTYSEFTPGIAASGLKEGTFASPEKYPSGYAAQQMLALPQHREDDAPPDVYWEIYTDSGTPHTAPMTVRRKYGRPGGGKEVLFPGRVSPSRIKGPYPLNK